MSNQPNNKARAAREARLIARLDRLCALRDALCGANLQGDLEGQELGKLHHDVCAAIEAAHAEWDALGL
jgi:hypothetical protein